MGKVAKKEKPNVVRENLKHTIFSIETPAPTFRGKVRDLYDLGSQIIIVTTDRVSAFDKVLGTVPFKGELLTEQACFWLNRTKNIVNNHLTERLDAQVLLCQKAEPIHVEFVVRGYFAGSLLRARDFGQSYGVQIDSNAQPYSKFPNPIVTPTTKANFGHDTPLTFEDIYLSGIASRNQAEEMKSIALELYERGSTFAETMGLILADAKYEFGLVGGKLMLIDEIHTADSSRYWIKSNYQERLDKEQAPEMLDKERLRSVLIREGYIDKTSDSSIPKLDESLQVDLGVHYWLLTEKLLGKKFHPMTGLALPRVKRVLESRLKQH